MIYYGLTIKHGLKQSISPNHSDNTTHTTLIQLYNTTQHNTTRHTTPHHTTPLTLPIPIQGKHRKQRKKEAPTNIYLGHEGSQADNLTVGLQLHYWGRRAWDLGLGPKKRDLSTYGPLGKWFSYKGQRK